MVSFYILFALKQCDTSLILKNHEGIEKGSGKERFQSICTIRFLLIFFFFCFGFNATHSIVFPTLPDNHVSHFSDQKKYHIHGMVLSAPLKMSRKTRFDFSVDKLRDDKGNLFDVTGKIRVSVYSPLSGFRYGDRLWVKGKIKLFRNFSNPGGFDYVRYMNLNGMWGSTNVNGYHVEFDADLPKRSLMLSAISLVNHLRENFEKRIYNILEDPDAAAVLSALVTGKKDKISSRLKTAFARSGASHILAISGTHLSIIATISFWFFNRLMSLFLPVLIRGWSRKLAALLTIFPLIGYALFSGFSPSTRRALIMIVIFMSAYVIERESNAMNSLAAAGLGILTFDPVSLFSVSFQLSFVAVFFILMGLRLISVHQVPIKKNVFTGLAGFVFISVCAITGTQPIVMYYFHLLSFSGVLSNLIVIPVVGFLVLPLGIAAFLMNALCQSLSFFFIQSAGFILKFCISMIFYISDIQYSWVETFTPDILEMACYYLFFYVIFRIALQIPKRNLAPELIVAGGLLTGLVVHETMLVKSRFFNKTVCCTALDVGQGSSTLVQLPGGLNFLVDGGGFSYFNNFDTGEHIIAPVLRQKRILTLEGVILTHPEADHINGLVYILKHFKVKQLIKNCDTRDTYAYRDLMNAAQERGVAISLVNEMNEKIGSDDWEFHFFHPFDSSCDYAIDAHPDYNNNSVVFKLIFKDVSILFPGDIMADTEAALVMSKKDALRSRVLVVPHHGSSTSTTRAFLDVVRPEIALISCGWQNRFGFPHESVLNALQRAGSEIYRTDLAGAVQICSDGSKFDISTCRGE